MLPWLELSEPDSSTLALAWGSGDGWLAGAARLDGWAALRESCRRTQRRCERAGWTLLDVGIAAEIQALETAHAAALTTAWQAIEGVLPASLSQGPFACVRGRSLLDLPVGALVAAAAPRRAGDTTLPFDAHPELELSGPDFAGYVAALPRPRADQLTLLIADDLGQGAFLSQVAPEGQRLGITAEGLAELLAFVETEQRALRAAEAAGVRIVRGFSVETFVSELLEPVRPFMMIAAHLEPSSPDSEGGIACSDGQVRLPPLFELMSDIGLRGGGLPLASVDLLLCKAADELARCFFAAGVLATNAACSLIPSGKLLVLLERLFDRRLLDGSRAFQHAWAASALAAEADSSDG